MLAVLILFQVLDGLTTWFAITRHGAREANPVVAWFLARFGLIPGLVAAKAIGAGASLWLATVSPLAALVCAAVYAWIIWNNWQVIRNA